MKKLFGLMVVLVLLSVPGLAQDDLSKQLAAAGSAKEYPGASYLVVFDRTTVRVEESGLSHVEKEVLYKVLDSAGGKELQSLTFGYDPLSAWVEVKEMKVLRANGGSETVPLTAVRDYPAPARAIYWGAREIIVPAGRLEPGDGVFVRTYQKGFTYALLGAAAEADAPQDDRYIPPMKGHFYDIVPFYSSIPVKVKSYRLSLPATKKLQFEMYNGSARHYAHAQGDHTEYFWEVKDIAPFQNEADMVDPSDVAPKLLVSTSPDWQAKSLWFFKVNEDYGSFEFDAEIKAKADAENQEKGRTPMTVEQILAQDPHSKPATTDRSPAPFVHATCDSIEMEFREAYRAFVDAYRAGTQRLRDRARELRNMFPLWAFPPALPFNAPA